MSEPQGIEDRAEQDYSYIEIPVIDEPEPIRISGGFRLPRIGVGDGE